MKESKKQQILLVEDEPSISRALSLKLSIEGYEVSIASQGKTALEQLALHTFDLILLDILMPVIDGYAVLAEMKKRAIVTPVIVLSNLGLEEDAKKAKNLGAKDFFVKANMPISQVVEMVRKVLG